MPNPGKVHIFEFSIQCSLQCFLFHKNRSKFDKDTVLQKQSYFVQYLMSIEMCTYETIMEFQNETWSKVCI